eukprot:TRINITY_DN13972_c0_g1_i1.p1 TRINITY_DN13972_c0_g1~~TRINITY_DN13972_c0_g1_i1.p1  ORF type:complete len:656 (+),score=196.94 TRINITY_DN13972_c0_g1_i1:57-1970(+)
MSSLPSRRALPGAHVDRLRVQLSNADRKDARRCRVTTIDEASYRRLVQTPSWQLNDAADGVRWLLRQMKNKMRFMHGLRGIYRAAKLIQKMASDFRHRKARWRALALREWKKAEAAQIKAAPRSQLPTDVVCPEAARPQLLQECFVVICHAHIAAVQAWEARYSAAMKSLWADYRSVTVALRKKIMELGLRSAAGLPLQRPYQNRWRKAYDMIQGGDVSTLRRHRLILLVAIMRLPSCPAFPWKPRVTDLRWLTSHGRKANREQQAVNSDESRILGAIVRGMGAGRRQRERERLLAVLESPLSPPMSPTTAPQLPDSPSAPPTDTPIQPRRATAAAALAFVGKPPVIRLQLPDVSAVLAPRPPSPLSPRAAAPSSPRKPRPARPTPKGARAAPPPQPSQASLSSAALLRPAVAGPAADSSEAGQVARADAMAGGRWGALAGIVNGGFVLNNPTPLPLAENLPAPPTDPPPLPLRHCHTRPAAVAPPPHSPLPPVMLPGVPSVPPRPASPLAGLSLCLPPPPPEPDRGRYILAPSPGGQTWWWWRVPSEFAEAATVKLPKKPRRKESQQGSNLSQRRKRAESTVSSLPALPQAAGKRHAVVQTPVAPTVSRLRVSHRGGQRPVARRKWGPPTPLQPAV